MRGVPTPPIFHLLALGSHWVRVGLALGSRWARVGSVQLCVRFVGVSIGSARLFGNGRVGGLNQRESSTSGFALQQNILAME